MDPRYYVAYDSSEKCISCMSHRPTHRPTCEFQAVVRNTRNAGTASDAIKKQKYATHARNRSYPCVGCVFRVRALHALRFLCPARRKGAITFPFVCLSVRPSVPYIANNSRTQRPSVPKFRMKVL